MKAVVALVLAAGLAACGGPEEAPVATPGVDVDAPAAVEALCAARRAALDGRVDEAGEIFDERAHGALHRLEMVTDDPSDQFRLQERTTAAEDALGEADADIVAAAFLKTVDAVAQVDGADVPSRCEDG